MRCNWLTILAVSSAVGKKRGRRHNESRQARKIGRRVLRGGSFNNSPENLRSANRDDDNPENRNDNNGFRCVRVPPQHAAPGFFESTCGDAMQRLPGPVWSHIPARPFQ